MLAFVKRNVFFLAGLIVLLVGLGSLIQERSVEAAAYDIHLPLRVSNRSQLEVCVGTVPETASSHGTALREVKTSLADLANSDALFREVFGTYKVVVNSGCPGEAKLHRKGIVHPSRNSDFPYLELVTKAPTRYFLYVWVTPQETLEQAFPGMAHHTVFQEMMCDEHACGAASNALYVTPEELQDSATLKHRISQGLDLAPKFELLPDTGQPKP